MKKILLATALLAMAAGMSNAATIKVLHNGEEVADGSTIEVNALDIVRVNDTWEDEGETFVDVFEEYSLDAHLSFVNTSDQNITLGGTRALVSAGPADWVSSWCINQTCVAADKITPQPMGANEVFSGNKSHIYIALGSLSTENDEVLEDTRAGYGEAEYKYTLYVGENPGDKVTFNVHYVYNEDSPVYVNGELGVGTMSSEIAKAEYYNLQGVRVGSPVKGQIYIVKRGAKVSKEIAR